MLTDAGAAIVTNFELCLSAAQVCDLGSGDVEWCDVALNLGWGYWSWFTSLNSCKSILALGSRRC